MFEEGEVGREVHIARDEQHGGRCGVLVGEPPETLLNLLISRILTGRRHVHHVHLGEGGIL